MPSSARSLRITDLYRQRLVGLGHRAQNEVAQAWSHVDLADFEPTYGDWLGSASSQVARAQLDAVRQSAAYLTAFISSELGHRVRTTQVDATRYVGLSRDGRSLAEALDSPRIGTLAALKDGADNAKALDAGLQRALRMVDLDTLHAGRSALLDAIEADERTEGWQRALRGTCGACAGVAEGLANGTDFATHPNCQCVPEPSVRGRPETFPRATGAAIFAAKTKPEQDEMLGPEAAELVRTGAATLSDLVRRSALKTADDFITQAPDKALT